MAGSRQRLYERDGKWLIKVWLRVFQTTLCAISIACAVFVLARRSTFQSEPWTADHAVLYYLPAVGATIVFNVFFVVFLLKKGYYFSLMYTSIIHFIFTFAFAILGCYTTIVVVKTLRRIGSDPYSLADTGSYNGVSENGTTIEVTYDNARTCPAFDSCGQQQAWMAQAHTRAVVAVFGSGLVDVVFGVHLILFFWCTNDSVFGTRPRGWRDARGEQAEQVNEPKPPSEPPQSVPPIIGSETRLMSQLTLTGHDSQAFSPSSLSLTTLASNTNSQHNPSNNASPPSPQPDETQARSQSQLSFREARTSTATAVSIHRLSGTARVQSFGSDRHHSHPQQMPPSGLARVVSEANAVAAAAAAAAGSSVLAVPADRTSVRRSTSTPDLAITSVPQGHHPSNPKHPPPLLTGPIFGTPTQSPPTSPPSSARSSPRSSVLITPLSPASSPQRISQHSLHRLQQRGSIVDSEPGATALSPVAPIAAAATKTKPVRQSLLRNVQSFDGS